MAVYELYEKNSYVFFDVEDARVLYNLLLSHKPLYS